MVYDWDEHRDTIFRLYVKERKCMDEVIEYMKAQHRFTPSKRAYQAQIRKWDFPSKQVAAHRNKSLVDRVRELWESNRPQREMLRVLTEEGHDVSARQLLRIRTHHRWLLREPKKEAAAASTAGKRGGAAAVCDGDANTTELTLESLLGHPDDEDPDLLSQQQRSTGVLSGDGGDGDGTVEEQMMRTTAAAFRREQRREQLAAESAERWEKRKRRRRTRGWAGLPADPPGPPRFPSETTLAESKVMLGLDAESYRDVRDRFRRICEEEGLGRKRDAGQAAWEAAKEKLVRETPGLRAVMRDPEADEENEDNDSSDDGEDATGAASKAPAAGVSDDSRRALALDVICMDVTKRMRQEQNVKGRPSLAEVKNILGVNPDESRQLRLAFYRILSEENFTSKLEVGPERWEKMKDAWTDACPELQRALPSSSSYGGARGGTGGGSHSRAEKLMAIDVFAKDMMKRFRDQRMRGQTRGLAGAAESLKLRVVVDDDNDGGAAVGQGGGGGGPGGPAAILDPDLGDMDDVLDGAGYGHHHQLSLLPGTPAAAQLQMAVSGVPLHHPSPQEQQQQQQRQHQQQQQQQHRLLTATPVIDPSTGLPLDPQIDSSLLLAADAQTAAAFVDHHHHNHHQQYMQELDLQQAAFHHHHHSHHNLHSPHHHHHHQAHDVSQSSSAGVVGPGLPGPGGGGGVGDGGGPASARHLSVNLPVAVYLRAHHGSALLVEPSMWIGALTSPALDELRAVAVEKYPGAICLQVEGVIKDPKVAGMEVPLPIGSDEELAAYLAHVQGLGVAPTFCVQIMGYDVA